MPLPTRLQTHARHLVSFMELPPGLTSVRFELAPASGMHREVDGIAFGAEPASTGGTALQRGSCGGYFSVGERRANITGKPTSDPVPGIQLTALSFCPVHESVTIRSVF